MFVIPPHSSTPRWMPDPVAGETQNLGGATSIDGSTCYSRQSGRPCKRRMGLQAKRRLEDGDEDDACDAVRSSDYNCTSSDGADSRPDSQSLTSGHAPKRLRLSLSGIAQLGQQTAELSPATFYEGLHSNAAAQAIAPDDTDMAMDASGMDARMTPPTMEYDEAQYLRLQVNTPTGHPHPYMNASSHAWALPTPPRSCPSSPTAIVFGVGKETSAGASQHYGSRYHASQGSPSMGRDTYTCPLPSHDMRSSMGASYFDPRF